MTPIAVLALPLLLAAAPPAGPFVITVVDEQTGRGVPLVELNTVHGVRLVTDSAGVAVFDEPGLMGQLEGHRRKETPMCRVWLSPWGG